MKTCPELVEDAVQGTVFYSPRAFSWFGKRSEPLSPKTRASLSAQSVRNAVVAALQAQLYGSFYSKGAATASHREDPPPTGPANASPFAERLRRANQGPGYWTDGWRIASISGERVIVEKDGRLRTARADQCRAAPGAGLAPGGAAAVHFPSERASISPGFYMAVHRGLKREDPVVRMYWNTTSEVAVILTREITSALGQADYRFRFKTAISLEGYGRCDASVLYFGRGDYEAIRAIVEEIFPRVADGLKVATPVFTKVLAPGIGLAEDPGEKLSFGEHRCRILADGLLSAHEQGRRTLADRMAVVRARFAEAEIDLERPFLNPGSSDQYGFDPGMRTLVSVPRCSRQVSSGPAPRVYSRTVQAIASRLCREAVWHEGRCNWVGPLPSGEDSLFGALGPSFYDGTSGVGLFLAELSAVSGDAACARTASGALRQALSAADSVAEPQRLGFYNGWVGMAYAAARAGELLGDTELTGQARSLLDRCAAEPDGDHDLDITSGIAGGIPALLTLSSMLSGEGLAEQAVRLGNQILDQAVEFRGALCWRTINARNEPFLTGFSHGNAGICWALLELFEATRDSRYRNAAELGLAYERRWFDAGAGNWPDFRGVTRWGKGGAPPVPCMTAWCHGAPGIALSRLRAYQILREERCREEAIAALRTTRAGLQRREDRSSENYSLCHGLAGNADILLTGRAVLGDEASFDDDLADNAVFGVANSGIDAHARAGDWPCGIRGTSPGLMLGLAGIGHFYLRLACPSTPSVLMVGPAKL